MMYVFYGLAYVSIYRFTVHCKYEYTYMKWYRINIVLIFVCSWEMWSPRTEAWRCCNIWKSLCGHAIPNITISIPKSTWIWIEEVLDCYLFFWKKRILRHLTNYKQMHVHSMIYLKIFIWMYTFQFAIKRYIPTFWVFERDWIWWNTKRINNQIMQQLW